MALPIETKKSHTIPPSETGASTIPTGEQPGAVEHGDSLVEDTPSTSQVAGGSVEPVPTVISPEAAGAAIGGAESSTPEIVADPNDPFQAVFAANNHDPGKTLAAILINDTEKVDITTDAYELTAGINEAVDANSKTPDTQT